MKLEIKEQLRKKVMRSGNCGAIWVPREWLGEEIIVTRLETPKLSIKEEITKILIPHLENIVGIYLYGSYARKEETSGSDIDILVIAKNKFKLKNLKKFDINIISIDGLKNKIKKDIFLYSTIKESTPIINSFLLKELKAIKFNFKNLKWFKETTKISIKEIKEFIELDKLEGDHILSLNVIYSLILRLRGVFLIKCLKNNKVFSNKLFKKWITKHISDYEFKQVYSIYRALRDNKKVDIKVEIRIAEILLDLLKIENGK